MLEYRPSIPRLRVDQLSRIRAREALTALVTANGYRAMATTAAAIAAPASPG
jgi:hypothetical protein